MLMILPKLGLKKEHSREDKQVYPSSYGLKTKGADS